MSILVVNAGSSTLKFGLFEEGNFQELAHGLIDWSENESGVRLALHTSAGEKLTSRLEKADACDAMTHLLDILEKHRLLPGGRESIAAVGHRIVHGGVVFRDSVRIDRKVKSAIERLVDIAPLHNPPGLAAIEAAEAALPGAPHVAVFDTAFHAAMSESAFLYPLPYEWYERWGVRRFGFHGISHQYCAGRGAEMLGRPLEDLRLIICHMGNGASATAVRGGISIFNTMGLTPIEGLMMGTRSGSVDPGALVYVEQKHGLTADDLEDVLNHRCGLLGVSGLSGDYREVESAAGKGNERARLALDMYAARTRATIGALAAMLGGLDAVVFTAGVGENSASFRASASRGLKFLGLDLDLEANARCRPDEDVAESDSPVRILVIATREELLIAREAARVAGV